MTIGWSDRNVRSNAVTTRRIVILAVGCNCLLSMQSAFAQQTVQQPVVEVISAETVVSVPDRGRLFLGGVGSAGATQKSYGPLRWGTATGRFSSQSSLDVGVFIHDFRSMDEYLLSLPTSQTRRPETASRFRSTRAASAWRRLQSSP